ncbi:hypothetical protein C1H46_024975 [Malus baccata]|uniref:RRM domain-containing protein n=1 Tax=Malus baccata TaxID=106549 RepID=A0A540LSF4_MALBA|nr:hypothetical protein C1H46_024975 [Malus baccata]
MSHFGRSGPPDIRETYSLLVLNITFRKSPFALLLHHPLAQNPNSLPLSDTLSLSLSVFTGTTADDLFPLFDKYGKVVDVFIPRDRRTGDSRGFAFVRYRDEYKEKDYGSRSRSREKYSRDRHHRSEREHRYRSRSRSASPDNRKRGRYDDERRSRSRSYGSASPVRNSPKSRRSPSPRRSSSPRRSPSPRMSASPRRSASPQRSPSPRTTPSRGENVDGRNRKERSPTPKDVSPHGRRDDSPSLSPRKSDADVSGRVNLLIDEML